jgi:hypothetical protein
MNGMSTVRSAARVAYLLVSLLAAGCASTQIASSWRDPADKGGAVKKVVVFVAAQDDAIRRLAENRAVQSLPRGTVGVPSYTLFEKPETDVDKVKARLAKEGFDGALISRLVSHDRSEAYVPPQTHIVQPYPFYTYRPYYRSFYGYYPEAYAYTTPGYVSETQRYLVETLLYRLPEGKPVWSAVSETVNPDSKIALVNEIVRVVTQQLRTQGLLAE